MSSADVDFRLGFLGLPPEIKRLVILCMDLPTIKATRLTCKLLCYLSTPYLIPSDFHFFADRADFIRISQLCRHPIFSKKIQTIEVNLGEIHICYYYPYMGCTSMFASSSKAIARLKLMRDEYARRISDQDGWSEVFRSLPKLSALSVSMENCPFIQLEPGLDQMKPLWSSLGIHRDFCRKLTKERFATILSSLLPNVENLKFKSLSHDRLPIEFFSMYKTTSKVFAPIFYNLTDLRLVLDYSGDVDDSIPKAFINVATCLKDAANLQNLKLCFRGKPHEILDITPFFENMLSNSDESKSALPRLQSLHMAGIGSKFDPFKEFLVSLASSLQVLEFGIRGKLDVQEEVLNSGIVLLDGKFPKLVDDVHEAISLKKFKLGGNLMENLGDKKVRRYYLNSHLTKSLVIKID